MYIPTKQPSTAFVFSGGCLLRRRPAWVINCCKCRPATTFKQLFCFIFHFELYFHTYLHTNTSVNVVGVDRKYICITQACAPRHTLIEAFSQCAIQAFKPRRRLYSGRWSANSRLVAIHVNNNVTI